MKAIIGLGQAGCNIADEFAKYPEYDIYKIDVDIKGKNCYSIKKQDRPELYEKACPNLKTFFKNIKGEVLFVTSCGYTSGAALRILEQIKNKCNISILYVKPDISLLSDTKKLQEISPQRKPAAPKPQLFKVGQRVKGFWPKDRG